MKSLKEIWIRIRNNEEFSELKKSNFKDILTGNFLISDFIQRQFALILLIAILAFTYIDNRYYCEKQQSQVVQLQKQLKDLRYEALTTSAELIQMSRQSNVSMLLNERNVNLQISTEPPIRIK